MSVPAGGRRAATLRVAREPFPHARREGRPLHPGVAGLRRVVGRAPRRRETLAAGRPPGRYSRTRDPEGRRAARAPRPGNPHDQRDLRLGLAAGDAAGAGGDRTPRAPRARSRRGLPEPRRGRAPLAPARAVRGGGREPARDHRAPPLDRRHPGAARDERDAQGVGQEPRSAARKGGAGGLRADGARRSAAGARRARRPPARAGARGNVEGGAHGAQRGAGRRDRPRRRSGRFVGRGRSVGLRGAPVVARGERGRSALDRSRADRAARRLAAVPRVPDEGGRHAEARRAAARQRGSGARSSLARSHDVARLRACRPSAGLTTSTA